jgi:hypothetical protein
VTAPPATKSFLPNFLQIYEPPFLCLQMWSICFKNSPPFCAWVMWCPPQPMEWSTTFTWGATTQFLQNPVSSIQSNLIL